ncbi:MAG: hypothetical protein AAF491_02665, partial [Verrucomicrobiota bacterium]
MDKDPLSHLLARLEAGTATDAELEQLEKLLETDYEARERFLDHTQIEGILHGVGQESRGAEVIRIEPELKRVNTSSRATKVGVLVSFAAILVLSLFV